MALYDELEANLARSRPKSSHLAASVVHHLTAAWVQAFPLPTEVERMVRLQVPQDRIEEFCRNHHIRTLALFGSVLRDDFGPDSDVDVLVELESGHRVGLIALAGMELELGEILGRKADLRTANDLSRYFRDEVARTAEVLYAA